jgi:hypothetical protein
MVLTSVINKSQRLFIELGTYLRLESITNNSTISGELIGMRVGDYLIVRLQGCNKRIDQIKELQVKYLCSGEIFGFSAQVLTVLNEPDQLVFLDYPAEVESFNVRSFDRVDCFLPVHLSFQGNSIDGLLVNINFQGCLCCVDDNEALRLPQDQVIPDVNLKFPAISDTVFAVSGEIRFIRKEADKLYLGIYFRDMDDFFKSALRTLVPALNF